MRQSTLDAVCTLFRDTASWAPQAQHVCAANLEAARRVVQAAVDHPRAASAGVMIRIALGLQHRDPVPQRCQAPGSRQADHACAATRAGQYVGIADVQKRSLEKNLRGFGKKPAPMMTASVDAIVAAGIVFAALRNTALEVVSCMIVAFKRAAAHLLADAAAHSRPVISRLWLGHVKNFTFSVLLAGSSEAHLDDVLHVPR